MKIKLNEEDHKYTIGEKELISVSKVIDAYREEFKREEMAERYAMKNDMPVEAVLKMWDTKRTESCERGTLTHKKIEDLIRTGKIDVDNEEIKKMVFKAKEFIECVHGKEKILLEKIIYNNEWGIAGTADLLLVDEKRKIIDIYDWKTNEKYTNGNVYRTFKKPIEHLCESKYNGYALQLSIYGLLALSMPEFKGYKINRMANIWLPTGQEIWMPFMKMEAQSIIDDYRLYGYFPGK